MSLEEIEALSKSLLGNTCLKELELYRNKIEEEGFILPGKSLKQNRTLKKLSIDKEIRDEELEFTENRSISSVINSFLKLLKENCILEELLLFDCRITEEGAK